MEQNKLVRIAQVAPDQNQFSKNAKWDDAFGDRVKVRIPGKHPQDNETKDDELPWAIVSLPTSSGNYNFDSSGIIGGEWVLIIYPDNSDVPHIINVLSKNERGFDIKKSIDGSTYFKRVSRYTSGMKAKSINIVGEDNSKPKGPAQPSKREFEKVKSSLSEPPPLTAYNLPNGTNISSDGKFVEQNGKQIGQIGNNGEVIPL